MFVFVFVFITLQVLPGIRKMITTKLECNLRVIKEVQQQESMRFMALFERKMTVLRGHRFDMRNPSEPMLLQVHSWRPATYVYLHPSP